MEQSIKSSCQIVIYACKHETAECRLLKMHKIMKIVLLFLSTNEFVITGGDL